MPQPWIAPAIGFVVGLVIYVVMAAMIRRRPVQRDVYRLPATPASAPTIEQWAATYGFALKQEQGATRVYRRGLGLLGAPILVDATIADGVVTLEGYTRVNALLFVAEVPLADRSFYAKGPRIRGLKEFNALITALGGQAIG